MIYIRDEASTRTPPIQLKDQVIKRSTHKQPAMDKGFHKRKVKTVFAKADFIRSWLSNGLQIEHVQSTNV
jgi:hypothetical protein